MRVWHMLKNGWRVIRWSTTYEHVLNNVIKNEFAGPLNMKIYNNVRVIAGHLLKKKKKNIVAGRQHMNMYQHLCYRWPTTQTFTNIFKRLRAWTDSI